MVSELGSTGGPGFPQRAEGDGNSVRTWLEQRQGGGDGSSFLGTFAFYLLQGRRVGPSSTSPGNRAPRGQGSLGKRSPRARKSCRPLSFLPTCSELWDRTALSASPGPRQQEGRSWSPASSLAATGWPHSSAAVQVPVTAPASPFGRGMLRAPHCSQCGCSLTPSGL